MKEVAEVVAFIANLLTALASGIAIYVFVAKRDYISSAFKALINYSTQPFRSCGVSWTS